MDQLDQPMLFTGPGPARVETVFHRLLGLLEICTKRAGIGEGPVDQAHFFNLKYIPR